MAVFFISYSRKDSEFAESLRKHIQLLDSVHEIFLDIYSIKIGANWLNTLKHNIENSQYFILILSNNSIQSPFVKKEIAWVKAEETKTGVRKLFIVRIDSISIPPYLSSQQIIDASGNFTVDFYKLMDGIKSNTSYFKLQHKISSDPDTGYWIRLYVDAPFAFLKLIERVEYRFDYEFDNSAEIDSVEVVDRSSSSIKKKFGVEFWTPEPILVFVVIYLASIKQITFEHRISLYF